MTSINIPLTKGEYTVIDDEDLALAGGQSWCAVVKGRVWYAQGSIGNRRVYLHRLITNAKPGQVVDHINGDGLDNRRSNLRVCTQAENTRNRHVPQASNTTGLIGVNPHQGGFRARICVNSRQIDLGVFPTPQEAARARDTAAIRLHGPFSQTNEALGFLDEGKPL